MIPLELTLTICSGIPAGILPESLPHAHARFLRGTPRNFYKIFQWMPSFSSSELTPTIYTGMSRGVSPEFLFRLLYRASSMDFLMVILQEYLLVLLKDILL